MGVGASTERSITRQDLATLADGVWLNDEVINRHIELLCSCSQQSAQRGEILALNSFFMPKLLGSGAAAVHRWVQRVDLFAAYLLLIPVHHAGCHWCLLAVWPRQLRICFFDPLAMTNGMQYMKATRRFLVAEAIARQRPIARGSFEMEARLAAVQQNGHDCGVLVCEMARALIRDHMPASVPSEYAAYLRRRILVELMTQEADVKW